MCGFIKVLSTKLSLNMTSFIFKLKQQRCGELLTAGYWDVCCVCLCDEGLYGRDCFSASRATVAALCSAFRLLLALRERERERESVCE